MKNKIKKKTVKSFTVNYMHSETLMRKRCGKSYNTFPMLFRVLLNDVCIVFSFFVFSNCKNIFLLYSKEAKSPKNKKSFANNSSYFYTRNK
jgi:hypothetical protein